MFGDEPIIGNWEKEIDSKIRVVLPEDTRREYKEELVLAYDEVTSKYVIYKLTDALKNFESYDQKIQNASSIKELEELRKEKLQYAITIKKHLTVDIAGRVTMSGYFKKFEKISLVGNIDTLYIIKNEENCKVR